MLLAVVWILDAPITAIGGSDILVALGSGPFFDSFWLHFSIFDSIFYMGRYIFLIGENIFLSYICGLIISLPSIII